MIIDKTILVIADPVLGGIFQGFVACTELIVLYAPNANINPQWLADLVVSLAEVVP